MAKFVYFICNQGSANLLKEELLKKHRYFNVAFARQTFLTFKRSDGKETTIDFNPQCVFARAFGISLGKAKISEIGLVLQSELIHSLNKEYVLHEWNPDGKCDWTVRPELEQILQLKKDNTAKVGDLIIDVVKMNPTDYFLGIRKRSAWQTPYVGGTPPFDLPEEAPSRAWLKTEEAIELTGAQLMPGETVLEIGSAPGGSVYNFLKRDLKVYGVDTGEMHESCLKNKNFTHLNMTMQKIDRSLFKTPVKWLLLDINQKPSYALRELRRIIPLFKGELKGLFLTFKLTDQDSIKKMDANIKELTTYGLQVTPTQLFHNRNEVFFYAVPSN